MIISWTIYVAANSIISLFFISQYYSIVGFSGGSDGKEFACNAEDQGFISGLGRTPEGGHSNPLQYSCWENPHGHMSLAGYSPWGHKEPDKTERLSTAQHSTMFHCIYVSHLLYLFIWQLTFGLLPCLDYCKQCFSDHWGADIHVFFRVYAQEWNCWIIQGLFLASYGTSIVFLHLFLCCCAGSELWQEGSSLWCGLSSCGVWA